jgi:hypothetical protein
MLIRKNPEWRRKYRISIIIALAVPLMLCPIFKYFLLVPLPYEGGVVEIMDLIRYSLF